MHATSPTKAGESPITLYVSLVYVIEFSFSPSTATILEVARSSVVSQNGREMSDAKENYRQTVGKSRC